MLITNVHSLKEPYVPHARRDTGVGFVMKVVILLAWAAVQSQQAFVINVMKGAGEEYARTRAQIRV